jgi:hypothetical protein
LISDIKAIHRVMSANCSATEQFLCIDHGLNRDARSSLVTFLASATPTQPPAHPTQRIQGRKQRARSFIVEVPPSDGNANSCFGFIQRPMRRLKPKPTIARRVTNPSAKLSEMLLMARSNPLKLTLQWRWRLRTWLADKPQLRALHSARESLFRLYRTRGYRRARAALGNLTDALALSSLPVGGSFGLPSTATASAAG